MLDKMTEMYFQFFLTQPTGIQWRLSTDQYSTVHCPNLRIREITLAYVIALLLCLVWAGLVEALFHHLHQP
jgi:hypothetical protein